MLEVFTLLTEAGGRKNLRGVQEYQMIRCAFWFRPPKCRAEMVFQVLTPFRTLRARHLKPPDW